MLSIQPHLQSIAASPGVLAFAWDEWETKNYYWNVDKRLYARLDKLTDDANLSLTNALGEWICLLFARFDPDPAPLQLFEAAWAATVHPAYCVYSEVDEDEWRGPVRGPLAVAMTIATDAIFCRGDDPHVATRACWMFNLVRHVLPATAEFDRWYHACVTRLERYHSNTSEVRAVRSGLFDDLGGFDRPVPREAFDPQRPYDPAEIPALLDDFLLGLNVTGNPFLTSIVELAALDDLPGPPYRYVINSP